MYFLSANAQLVLALLVAEPAAPQGNSPGIKAGDTVTVAIATGWVRAIVLASAGPQFRVHIINGSDVAKTYPAELRRLGPANAYDHASGIYEPGDLVQVNYQGRWVDSRVVSSMGMEYQVELPGNLTGWATPAQLKFVRAKEVAAAPERTAPGKPPRPGFTICAGKFEGRYAASSGLPYTMTFRNGKVSISAPMINLEDGTCWIGDGKLVIVSPEGEPLDIDINDDGSLQTPFGEMKKKGK